MVFHYYFGFDVRFFWTFHASALPLRRYVHVTFCGHTGPKSFNRSICWKQYPVIVTNAEIVSSYRCISSWSALDSRRVVHVCGCAVRRERTRMGAHKEKTIKFSIATKIALNGFNYRVFCTAQCRYPHDFIFTQINILERYMRCGDW